MCRNATGCVIMQCIPQKKHVQVFYNHIKLTSFIDMFGLDFRDPPYPLCIIHLHFLNFFSSGDFLA